MFFGVRDSSSPAQWFADQSTVLGRVKIGPTGGVASYKGAGVLGRRRAARSGSTRVAEGSIGSSFSSRNLVQQFGVF